MAEESSSSDQQTSVGRRDLLKYTGAGAAGVALPGCKDRPPTAGGAGSGDGADGGGGATNATGDSSTNSSGTGEGSDGPSVLEGQTVKLGVLAPQPESFPVGMSMRRSAELAAEKINDTGGIAGADVEILVGNTEASPGTGREEFLRLVREERVVATFGTFLTQVTLQCFVPMKQTKTIHVTTAAAGPKPARIVHDRYDEFKYHFRVGPINSFDLAKAELEFMQIYAEKLGWDKVALLIENIGPFDPFFATLESEIDDIVDAPIKKRTSSGTTNWTPIFDEVENNDIDLAAVAQALTGTSSVKQWANQQRPFEFGGIHVPDQIYSFWEEVDGDCRYTFTMNAITPQTTNTPRTQPWMEKYRKQFDTFPVYSGPITYDGIRVYRKAVENAITDMGITRMPTSDELVPYLEDVKFTKGIILPEFQFTPKSAKYAHDPQWNSMTESGVPVWQQWQKDPEITEGYGVMHSFAPEQNKTASYSYPDWIDYPGDHPANQ